MSLNSHQDNNAGRPDDVRESVGANVLLARASWG